MKKSLLWILTLIVSIAMVSLYSGCAETTTPAEEAEEVEEEPEVTEEPSEETSEEPAAEEVSFTVYFHYTPQEARGVVIREIFNEWNELHSGEVKIIPSFSADWIPLQEKIRIEVTSGSPPDVFYYNYNPNDLSLLQSGYLMDFNPYMDDEWRSRFYASDLEKLTIDGELLSIPLEQGPVPFYYNKDLFDQAGIEEFPKTWDEFFDTCETLRSAGITPVSLFTAEDGWHATNYLSYFAVSLGGPDILVQENLNTPAMVEAARMLQNLFEYATEDSIGSSWAVSVQNFITGRSAILVDGPWTIGMLDGQMENPENCIAVAPPTLKEEDPYYMITDTITPWAASGIMSDNKKQAVADFLEYLTSEAITKRFAIDGKLIFATKTELSEEEKEMAGTKLAANIDLTANSEGKVFQITRVVKPAVKNEIPRLLEGLAIGTLTPEQFAEEIQKFNEE